MPLLLLAAHSWQLSQGSPGLRWPLAALGFLSASLGTSHQENLPQWFGMEGATKALEPLKPKPHTQPDPTTEPQVGTACGSPCFLSPQAGQDRGTPRSRGTCSKLQTLTSLLLSSFLLQGSVTTWKENRRSP